MDKYIGEIFMFGVQPPPARCVEAGGQELDRVKYADLFRVYGTTYGNGNGTTTFNVPDLRGRVAAGPNTMGGGTSPRLDNAAKGGLSGAAVGNTGGEQNHSLLGNASGTGGSSEQGPGYLIAGAVLAAGNDFDNIVATDPAEEGHNNVQPTIIIPFVIYAGVSA